MPFDIAEIAGRSIPPLPGKNELWVRKNTRAAAVQLIGAIRTGNERPVWCDHWRRGRIDFPEGLPAVRHGIVLVETFVPVDLAIEARELPLTYRGVPITYLSVSDFVNLALELRTVPELIAYLDARRAIPLPSLHFVGDEKCLFEFYLLENGTLSGCVGHADARVVVAARQQELRRLLQEKAVHDRHNKVMEYVADCLAIRNPDYASGLNPDIVAAAFDPSMRRANYIAMQEVVADLRLRERAELGRGLLKAVEHLADKAKGFSFLAAHFTSRDWVWILASSKDISRSELVGRMMTPLLHAAMAHYITTSPMG
ncbi:MAG TPA: hypothetical protein VFC15_13020 [Candidatus Limnocylindrales bacterium]|nr:hypothetical protein [Candidatus Limnocylindrales bacterium]